MKNFFSTALLLVAAAACPLPAQAVRPDTLESQVLWASARDSTITVAAGLKDGVRPGTQGIVYLSVDYLGGTWRNRIARCVLDTATYGGCTMKVVAFTAPVRPGYSVMLFGLTGPGPAELAEQREPARRPFYTRRWFWIVGGAAAATAIAILAGGGGGSSSTGTVTVSGSLP